MHNFEILSEVLVNFKFGEQMQYIRVIEYVTYFEAITKEQKIYYIRTECSKWHHRAIAYRNCCTAA